MTPFDQSPAHAVVTAMAPDGTALVGRVRTAGGIDAVGRRPGGQTSPPFEIARTDANRRVLLAGASSTPDGGFVVAYAQVSPQGDADDASWVVRLRPDGSVADRFTVSLTTSVAGFDAQGRMYVLAGADDTLTLLTRAAGAGATVDVPLPPRPNGGDVGLPALAVSPGGSVVIASVLSYPTFAVDGCTQTSELWVNRGTRGAIGTPRRLTTRTASGKKHGDRCTELKGQQILDPPSAAIDATDTATLLFPTGAEYPTTWWAVRGQSGAWHDEEPVGTPVTGAVGGLVPAGTRPTVAFISRLAPITVQWSVRNDDGLWSAPLVVAQPDRAVDVAAAGMSDGSSIFAWSDGSRLLARRATPGTVLAEPAVLAAGRSAPRNDFSPSVTLGADAAGNAIAGFVTGPERTPHYAGFDGVAPVMDGVNIPPAAAFGAPATFSVASVATAGGQVSVPAVVRDAAAPVFTAKPAVRGSAIAFALSEAANVVATVTRSGKGVRKGKRCVTPPKRASWKTKRCTRQVTVAELRGTFKAGSGKLTLPAKVRRTRGTYRITLAVTDSAGNTTTTTLTYRVKKGTR